jgi:hypothetical protein
VRLLALLGKRYHVSPHAALMGKTLAQVYETAPRDDKPVTDDELGLALTVRGRRRARTDGTVDIGGVTFETRAGFLAGKIVTSPVPCSMSRRIRGLSTRASATSSAPAVPSKTPVGRRKGVGRGAGPGAVRADPPPIAPSRASTCPSIHPALVDALLNRGGHDDGGDRGSALRTLFCARRHFPRRSPMLSCGCPRRERPP